MIRLLSHRPARRRACVAVSSALSAATLLAVSAGAGAQAGPTVDVHAIFGGGKTSGFTVGTVLQVQYNDPSGQTREKQVCWSPAPIDQPACTPTGTGAPAKAGTQQITVQLTNGQSVNKTFDVGAATTTLGSGTSNTPPVPYTVTCSTELYGDAGQQDPIHLVSPGEQVAAYYKANSSTVQVYDYSTNTAGFVASDCSHRIRPHPAR